MTTDRDVTPYNPDADGPVLALAQEHHRIMEQQATIRAETAQARVAQSDVTALNERSDALTAREGDIIAAAIPLQAQTPSALRAKASIIAAAVPFAFRGLDDVSDGQNQLAWSIVRDLAAMSGPCAPHPDAELIAACAEFDRLEMEYFRLFHGPTAIEDETARIKASEALDTCERQEPLVEFIDATPARTMEGLQAKARSILTENIDVSGTIASLLRDLVPGYDAVAIAEAGEGA